MDDTLWSHLPLYQHPPLSVSAGTGIPARMEAPSHRNPPFAISSNTNAHPLVTLNESSGQSLLNPSLGTGSVQSRCMPTFQKEGRDITEAEAAELRKWVPQVTNGVVDIGCGVCITAGQFKRLMEQEKDTRFARELSTCTWGSNNLAQRSVLRKKGKRNQSDSRQPLTPAKVEVMKRLFSVRLLKKGFPLAVVKERLETFNRALSDKIADVKKQLLKQ